MKTNLKLLLSMTILASISACASAGPVVTNISYNEGGSLSIEKCNVQANFFNHTMELQDCSTHELKIQK